MIASVIQRTGLRYPGPEFYFSPDEPFPEYPFDHVSGERNDVYRAVRDCLAQAGLDRENFGKPSWNPLREVIPEGSTVFVLCNFVQNRRENETEAQFFAKCTHGSVIRAVLDYVLLAVGRKRKVRFGNAPLQSCEWLKVLEDTGTAKVLGFYDRFAGGRVEACDLRLFRIRNNRLGGIISVADAADFSDEIDIDIGKDSLLENLYSPETEPKFRLQGYDPASTEKFHGPGKHVYMVNRKVLEADVILSIPKLKTHEKVGVTLGMKGCVGAITHKHCLAHYRAGSPDVGGDEYPDGSLLSRIESALSEHIERRNKKRLSNVMRIGDRILRKGIRELGGTLGGGWAKNDTAWRMALDIARILRHASRTGTLEKGFARKHLLLIDGIVAGEGHGPLKPDPVSYGLLLFSEDCAAGDYVGCRFMGFDPEKIPIVANAFADGNYPLTSLKPSEITTVFNGKRLVLPELAGLGIEPFSVIRRWKGQIEERSHAD